MSIFGFITIGVLVTLNSINFNLGSLNFVLDMFGIETVFNDFSVSYYMETFPNIVITLAIYIISPLVLNLLELGLKSLIRFYD